VARHARGLVAAPENALLELADLERVAQPSAGGVSLLSLASERLGLSARGYVRVLRVARTLADLEGEDAVLERHFAEAIRYRALEPRGSSPSDAEGKETP
jgi:magnesium chelatase family protein